MSEVNIKVEVAGSIYPLKVATEDEAHIREAVKLINTKIAEFERAYGVKDRKDVLGMVMLQLVAQLYKRASETEQELSHLKTLFAEVDEMLKKHLLNIRSLSEE